MHNPECQENCCEVAPFYPIRRKGEVNPAAPGEGPIAEQHPFVSATINHLCEEL
jgi:hypothetical protein